MEKRTELVTAVRCKQENYYPRKKEEVQYNKFNHVLNFVSTVTF